MHANLWREKASERGHSKALWLDDGVAVAATSACQSSFFRDLAFRANFPQQCRDKFAARSQLRARGLVVDVPERTLFRESC